MEQFLSIITNQNVLIGLGIAVAAYFGALLLILVIWTARDARRRSKNWFFRYAAPIFVLLFNLVGFLIYIVLRPSQTIKQRKNERRERELLRQANASYSCPSCEKEVDEDFAVCPHCKNDFRPLCECGATIELDWKRCGYCGVTIEKDQKRDKKYKAPIIA